MRISIIIALSCHLNRNIVLNTDPATQRSVLEEFGILADECSVLQSVNNSVAWESSHFRLQTGSLRASHWMDNEQSSGHFAKFSKQCSLATGNPMQGIACGQPKSVRDTYEIKNVVAREWVPRLSHLQRLL
jgi:hypothetical protein